MNTEKPVQSPCVNICYVDDHDICQGCYRSVEEINAWMRLDNDGRRRVLAKVAQREMASPFVNTTNKSA
ncbi:MAG: DUF1289 domain-containing protein [Gammaproteobacteria bacterium]|jgi:hypothetical protein|nr:DUF1289 domain-containing protein [Gammaproteobacteria bacterium]